jgi:hypothetical protein
MGNVHIRAATLQEPTRPRHGGSYRERGTTSTANDMHHRRLHVDGQVYVKNNVQSRSLDT